MRVTRDALAAELADRVERERDRVVCAPVWDREPVSRLSCAGRALRVVGEMPPGDLTPGRVRDLLADAARLAGVDVPLSMREAKIIADTVMPVVEALAAASK